MRVFELRLRQEDPGCANVSPKQSKLIEVLQKHLIGSHKVKRLSCVIWATVVQNNINEPAVYSSLKVCYEDNY
jgi:hypothetical protein